MQTPPATIGRLDLDSEQYRRFYSDHLTRYLFAVPYAKGKRVLDAGTGAGYGAVLLKTYGAESVEAVDRAEEMIAGAATRESQLPLRHLPETERAGADAMSLVAIV